MSKCLTVASEVKPFETERELRRQICRTGRKMYARCFVVASEAIYRCVSTVTELL